MQLEKKPEKYCKAQDQYGVSGLRPSHSVFSNIPKMSESIRQIVMVSFYCQLDTTKVGLSVHSGKACHSTLLPWVLQ